MLWKWIWFWCWRLSLCWCTRVFRQVEHDLISLEMTLPGYPAWMTSLSVSFQHIWFEHKLCRGRFFLCFLSCFTTSQTPWQQKLCRLMWEETHTLFLKGQIYSAFFFFFSSLVTWLSFQYIANQAFSLFCHLNMVMKLCPSFIRCLNSVCILFTCMWTKKNRKGSTEVFQYEEDKTIFIHFPEYNFIKVDMHWMKLLQNVCMSLLQE